ncbi:phage tail protein [Pseudidiomarina sp. PP-1MA]|uniref:Phage tail protein n=1 Tax=Pseudidiomarina sp. PP-1MA TaxID=3237706 RepID=A0AB39XBK1_9GAMM
MDAYLGEIRAFPYNFAPRYWLECMGQTLQVSQYPALYSIIGTKFGGSSTTYNLPDLRHKVIAQWGQGAGLSGYSFGQSLGANSVNLLPPQLPPHTHEWRAVRKAADSAIPTSGYLANIQDTIEFKTFTAAGTNLVPLHPATIGITGAGQAHENRQPVLAMGFYICVDGGEYPMRP